MITRTDTDERFSKDGTVVSSVVVVRDVTVEVTTTTIEAQAVTALTTNRTFLALATPTNAQAVAQTKALTRQVNGIIRLLIDRSSLADGTVD